jgi:hypothetical protein
MHPTNGSPKSKSSSTSAASTLRPRTRRLISVEDGLYPTSGSENDASPYGSRAPSPNPSSLLWRSNVTSAPSAFVRSASAQTSKVSREASATLSGLWGNSWSAIQGLATNVLGSETGETDTGSARRRKPQPGAHRRAGSNAPAKWGPSTTSASSHVGAGTQEGRESLVRAMKRKDLLTANPHMISDSVGRFKRRNSDDRTSASAPPGENEDRDALVYIHHVRPQDTLAGLTIKFNCQLAVLRKANRMWPNDSVQTKSTIVLPVDACGVKGRPVGGPNAHQEEDLLLGDYGDSAGNSSPNTNNLPNGWGSSIKDTKTNKPPVPSQSNTDSESPWIHDSWVLLPNDTTPTEIGRMPRRELGFFPPARRKSLAFSEANTPRASVDLSRPSTSTSSDTTKSPLSKASRPRAPSTLSSFSGPPGRHRSNSTFLQGPGGVGTMNMNVRSPGPAQDGLNKLFAAHLPNVAPPPGQEYFTPWAPSLLDADAGTYTQYGGGSGARTPLGGVDLQEIGGAIEGWVRKVGSQASKLLAETPTGTQGKRSSGPMIGVVGGDFGDLIELRDDAFEIGDGESDALRGRSREEHLIRESQQYQSARPDFNLVMRDRGRRGDSTKKD